ncbi:MAG: nucleotide sugar dehydrogenase [Planctomycetota bacterium]|nr:MAG: nucleotide sugar dehydrogenase [Planctomycetota bacterium]
MSASQASATHSSTAASTTAPRPDGPRTVGIVGLGYVGLPLLLAYAKAGKRAIGFDIDPHKPEQILAGKSYIKHIPSAAVAEARNSGLVDATVDFSRIAETDAVIICVPTPLDEHLEPDLSYVTDTLDAICPHLRPGHVVSLESTTYPGTTEEEVVPRVKARGLVPGESVFVVYSPEREDPGNPNFTAANIPKVVGGFTPACLEAGVALYRAAFETVVPVSSCGVAELTKLLENIYRAVNIGLVNELKIVADAMGIDIWEVIRAAATKPFGFTPFYPGPGLGGHCIPIDPFYLTWKAREYGVNTRFIELAGQINRSMPEYVVRRTMLALNERGKAVKGSRVLMLGLAYKADVDDMRESPTFELMDRFSDLGAVVSYHDPYVPVIGPTREHAKWKGVASAVWNRETINAADAVVIATAHKAVNLSELAAWAGLVIDTRDAMRGISGPATVIKS